MTTLSLRGLDRKINAWDPELSLILPPPIATLMTAGDPYLAANLQVIRGLVVSTKLDTPEQKALFAQLMVNANRLNPAHEDGYYVAQAILPWNGWIEENQEIQSASADARPWDWLPVFFQAFNRYYFLMEPGPASTILQRAAERASPGNREALLANAARWKALGSDPKEALRVIRAMLASNPSKPLQQELRARAMQIHGLIELRKAAEAYRQRKGESPSRLSELEGHGGLNSLPRDPFGEGYVLNREGVVVIKRPKPLQERFQHSSPPPR
jgi:hypothetical protein